MLRSPIEVGERSPIEGGGAIAPPQPSETWKPVVGWESKYSVSDHGRVKSHPKIVGNGGRRGETILAGSVDSDGYVRVALQRNGKSHDRRVHRLVLEAFVGPGRMGLHGNNRRDDNRLSNLRWGSHADNMTDRALAGTVAKGASNGRAKLSESQVTDIRNRLASGESRGSIRADYEISKTQMHNIATGDHWKHV